MAKFLKRRSAEDYDDGPCLEAPEPGKMFERLEALFEFLSVAAWEDGEPRERGTLIVFIEDGVWKACLSDKETSRTAFISGATFDKLLLSLDKGLREDSLEWRRKRDEKPTKGKRK